MYRQALVSDRQQAAYSFPATEYVKKEVEAEKPAEQLKEKGSAKSDYSYWSSANVLARYRASLSPEELIEHYKECAERERSWSEGAELFGGPWEVNEHRKFRIECMGYDEDYYKYYPYSGEDVE
jgi:hypothetical protein